MIARLLATMTVIAAWGAAAWSAALGNFGIAAFCAALALLATTFSWITYEESA